MPTVTGKWNRDMLTLRFPQYFSGVFTVSDEFSKAIMKKAIQYTLLKYVGLLVGSLMSFFCFGGKLKSSD